LVTPLSRSSKLERVIKAAAEALTLQEQALDVERSKFQAGLATAYEFIQYQRSLAEAKSAARLPRSESMQKQRPHSKEQSAQRWSITM
jgi:outer membrane protein TolC